MSKTRKLKQPRETKKQGSLKTMKHVATNLVKDYTNQAMKNIAISPIKEKIDSPQIKEKNTTPSIEEKIATPPIQETMSDTYDLIDAIQEIKNEDDFEKVKKMLESGVDPNVRTYYDKRTPLMLSIDYLQYAIEKNKDIYTGNTSKFKKYYKQLIDILLNPKSKVDTSLEDNDGNTALILACKYNLEIVANKLLKRGNSNLSAINKHRMNAFMYACNRMSNIAIKILDICPSIVEYSGSERFISGKIEKKFNETKRMLENKKTENKNIEDTK